ncbi:hypothetical protein [Mucilaginibacter pocheonensis]|uniref:Uncharacterized protein n=1 Tax=Mucilaginibacter pocheonensis TaxID=398050 RepID=A0ABU1T9Z9_9SPHI|nr:hypothetical protein [Mucilaginibacter pocheonensis]MDR6942167.1 hypothetical protein [Mucilaginibacter pocheonensis]
MQHNSLDRFKKLQVIILVACYFFIAVSHLFFLPRLTQLTDRNARSHNSIFKRKSEVSIAGINHINFLKRTDKFIVNDKKSAIDLLNMVVGSFILLLFMQQIWKLDPKYYLTFRWLPINSQLTYLTCCTFKI